MYDIERMKAFAKKAGEEVVEMHLLGKAYLKQYGQDAPELVVGSPDAPVVVLLAAPKKIKRKGKDGKDAEVLDLKETNILKFVAPGKEPEKLIPSHLPGPKGAVKKSHEASKVASEK